MAPGRARARSLPGARAHAAAAPPTRAPGRRHTFSREPATAAGRARGGVGWAGSCGHVTSIGAGRLRPGQAPGEADFRLPLNWLHPLRCGRATSEGPGGRRPGRGRCPLGSPAAPAVLTPGYSPPPAVT